MTRASSPSKPSTEAPAKPASDRFAVTKENVWSLKVEERGQGPVFDFSIAKADRRAS